LFSVVKKKIQREREKGGRELERETEIEIER
jgi:hypothetical protein